MLPQRWFKDERLGPLRTDFPWYQDAACPDFTICIYSRTVQSRQPRRAQISYFQRPFVPVVKNYIKKIKRDSPRYTTPLYVQLPRCFEATILSMSSPDALPPTLPNVSS